MARIVITGLGVLAPNGHGKQAFADALRKGQSGIRHVQELADLKFACQVGGIPHVSEELKTEYFSDDKRLAMNSSMTFAGIAAIDCWKDAGLGIPDDQTVDWDTGAVIGTGIGGLDTIGGKVVPGVNQKTIRRLGSTSVEQTMASSVSAFIGGLLGLGGQVTTNSSACNTGTEAIINGMSMIQSGSLKRVLVGGAEGYSPYCWAGFDAMRVLARGFNDRPAEASRPMSASSAGFVPSSGAGLLMLESLDSAQSRGAKIYAELLGAAVNSGGQRLGGSITAPNPTGVQRCIRQAVLNAGIKPSEIDLINGHLTATGADAGEIRNWTEALECKPESMPMIQSTKSMTGHALGAAGGLEVVASVLQLEQGFIHGSLNCEDLKPELSDYAERIIHKTKSFELNTIAKASFGFGDVNGCLILKKW